MMEKVTFELSTGNFTSSRKDELKTRLKVLLGEAKTRENKFI